MTWKGSLLRFFQNFLESGRRRKNLQGSFLPLWNYLLDLELKEGIFWILFCSPNFFLKLSLGIIGIWNYLQSLKQSNAETVVDPLFPLMERYGNMEPWIILCFLFLLEQEESGLIFCESWIKVERSFWILYFSSPAAILLKRIRKTIWKCMDALFSVPSSGILYSIFDDS